MEITQEFRLAAIAQYGEVKVRNKITNEIYDVVGLNRSTGKLLCIPESSQTKTLLYLSPDNMVMQLYSFREIADNHKEDISKIASSWDFASPLPAEDVNEWLDEIFNGNCATTADYVNGYEMSEIIDYLRSKRCVLPFRGIDLIESGIAEVRFRFLINHE